MCVCFVYTSVYSHTNATIVTHRCLASVYVTSLPLSVERRLLTFRKEQYIRAQPRVIYSPGNMPHNVMVTLITRCYLGIRVNYAACIMLDDYIQTQIMLSDALHEQSNIINVTNAFYCRAYACFPLVIH